MKKILAAALAVTLVFGGAAVVDVCDNAFGDTTVAAAEVSGDY